MPSTIPIIQVVVTLSPKKEGAKKEFNIILFTRGAVEENIRTSVPLEVLNNLFNGDLSKEFEPTKLYLLQPPEAPNDAKS